MLLLVSSRNNLTSAYGPSGFEAVLAKEDHYRTVLLDLGIPCRAVFVDDSGSMAPFGLEPILSLDASSIAGAIRRLRTALAGGPDAVTSVALMGGDSIVPFWRVLNPVTDRGVDPDETVLSDNPYAASEDTLRGWLAPSLPLGRICGADSGPVESLTGVLDRGIENHRARASRVGSCAIVNEEWLSASMRAGASLAAPVAWHLAPGFRVLPANQRDLDARFLYFNLHGFANDPGWKGYQPDRDEFVTALTPESFSSEYVSGTTVFAENCYGAQVAGRSAANSCALRMVEMGTSAFVGSTGLAYGSFLERDRFLINADMFAQFFFQSVVDGNPTGLSFARARAEFLDISNRDVLDPFEQKTALQFVLLGDPTLT
jgi:hypothetical protein